MAPNVLRVPEVGDQRKPIWVERSGAGYSLLNVVPAVPIHHLFNNEVFPHVLPLKRIVQFSIADVKFRKIILFGHVPDPYLAIFNQNRRGNLS